MLLIVAHAATGQVHLTPFIGINSTSMTKGIFGYEKGGNYIFGGIELEGRLKPKKISPLHVSLVTGVSYLSNGYYENSLFALSSIYYSASKTDLATRYVQVPIMIKLNWQPFPLVEDFNFFLGAGVSNNILTQARLTENVSKVLFTTDIFSPPQTSHYEDSKDITQFGIKNSLFMRFDAGLRYKRLHIAYRLSMSTGDMYFAGLEKTWAIPASESGYISGHTSAGSTNLKYSELVIGCRIF